MTWGTPVKSFVFLGLLVFKLEPMYTTSDGETTDADHRIMPLGRGIITTRELNTACSHMLLLSLYVRNGLAL